MTLKGQLYQVLDTIHSLLMASEREQLSAAVCPTEVGTNSPLCCLHQAGTAALKLHPGRDWHETRHANDTVGRAEAHEHMKHTGVDAVAQPEEA